MRSVETRRQFAGVLLFTPALLLIIFLFILPTFVLFAFSFFQSKSFVVIFSLTIENYSKILSSRAFWSVSGNTLEIALTNTILCLVISYPIASYIVYRARGNLILYLVLSSWLTSYLVRIFGWRMILGQNGLVNSSLMFLGITDAPQPIFLYNSFSVILALTHIYFPITLLTLVSALRDVRPEYIEAARDLGSSPVRAFVGVTLPMMHRGLVSAFMLTFILSGGDFITPQLLGGPDSGTLGLFISTQFRQAGNWPLGAAMTFLTLILVLLVYATLKAALYALQVVPHRRYH